MYRLSNIKGEVRGGFKGGAPGAYAPPKSQGR